MMHHAKARGLAAMGFTYAALVKTRVSQPGDRGDAVSWLEKAVDAWRAIQTDPTFGSPLRIEMHDAEEMLAAMRVAG